MFTIEADISKQIQKLNIIQRLAVPEAQKKTLYKFGFVHKNFDMPRYMDKVFRDPVPFTLKSVLYKVYDDSSMAFFIRNNVPKANDPAKYLYPVSKEAVNKTAYETKFSYWLRNYSGLTALKNRYPIPYKDANVKFRNGRMAGSEYTRVKKGLEKFAEGGGKAKGNAYRYYAIPSKSGKKASRIRSQGIYRVKGKGNPELLFSLARKRPQVPTRFDFKLATKQSVDKHIAKIFNVQLKKVLAKY
tara:strand:- start:202 stop:933 length:732 start_codon:yes stop_codon:yes gene_type:complete